MTLPEAMQALVRLEPERFGVFAPDVYQVVAEGDLYLLSLTGSAVLNLGLLSAALQELIAAKGWRWGKLGDGDVWIDGPRGEHHDAPIGHAEPDGQPFALTLARAVVAALEAGRDG